MTDTVGHRHLKQLETYFDFPPGSRVGVAKTGIIVPWTKAGCLTYIKFEKGDTCEVTEDRIINRTNDVQYPSVYATTQPRVVHEGGHDMPGPKLVPRSTGRTARWTDPGHPGALKSWDWPFPVGDKPEAWPFEYKRMRESVPTQAVLMDEFAKEAQDDARYNAVPTNTVRSKVEHI